MAHQRPAHGQHLLFAAGEGSGHLLIPLFQPGKEFVHHLQVLLNAAAFLGKCAHLQVFLDRHLQKDPPALRNQARPLATTLWLGTLARLSLKRDGTGFAAQ